MFKVADKIFEIDKAHVTAYCSERLSSLVWNVEVFGKPQFIEEAEETAAPRAESNYAFTTSRGEIHYWHEIVGRTVSWVDDYDEENESVRGMICFLEHAAIYDSTLKFLHNNYKNVYIEWQGVADLFLSEEYSYRVPFQIVTEVSLVVLCGTSRSEKEARDEIRPYLDDTMLRYDETGFRKLVSI